MSKINFLKLIDLTLGKTLCLLLSSPLGLEYKLKTALIIRPGGIGDAVLLLPLISSIKKIYPDVKIDILAEKRNHSIFLEFPGTRTVYQYDRPRQLFKVIRSSYDVVIDTEQWHRLSAVIARLSNPSVLIGFDTNERRRLLTHAISYSHEDYEVNSFINLLAPLGISTHPIHGEKWLDIPETLLGKADNLLRNLEGKSFITLFPGASTREKRWNIEKFKALVERVNSKGYDVVIIGSIVEKTIGEQILRRLNGSNLAGVTTLLETAAVITKSKLLVSGDSGVLHLAAAVGIPTVSIFGPSNIKKWAPRGGTHIVISKNLSCSPCSKYGYTPKCPINVRCMDEITVSEVIAAIEKLMAIE